MLDNEQFYEDETAKKVTKNYGYLPTKTIRNALNLILPKLSEQDFEDFSKYINKQFSQYGCVVLWAQSEAFVNLCNRKGIGREAYGNKEVLIRENKRIAYTKNFCNPPVEI